MKNILLAFAVMALVVGAGNANALTVNYVPTPAQTTTGVDNFATTFDMMVGMSVEVTWGNLSTTDFTWSSPGGLAGGVSDSNGFTLGSIGDSFSSSWALAPNNTYVINSIFIDAGTGGTVFDVWSGSTGTPNSANGHPFSVTSITGNFDITATYSGGVQIGSAAPVGDLYRYLNIDFTSTAINVLGGNYQGYFGANDLLSFRADTDNLELGEIDPVPEPSTMLLMGAGILGLVAYNRKRFNK